MIRNCELTLTVKAERIGKASRRKSPAETVSHSDIIHSRHSNVQAKQLVSFRCLGCDVNVEQIVNILRGQEVDVKVNLQVASCFRAANGMENNRANAPWHVNCRVLAQITRTLQYRDGARLGDEIEASTFNVLVNCASALQCVVAQADAGGLQISHSRMSVCITAIGPSEAEKACTCARQSKEDSNSLDHCDNERVVSGGSLDVS